MRVDPVTVEVIRNAFISIASQMNNNLARSAYTPIIYEMKDCSVGLFGANGETAGPSARTAYLPRQPGGGHQRHHRALRRARHLPAGGRVCGQ